MAIHEVPAAGGQKKQLAELSQLADEVFGAAAISMFKSAETDAIERGLTREAKVFRDIAKELEEDK